MEYYLKSDVTDRSEAVAKFSIIPNKLPGSLMSPVKRKKTESRRPREEKRPGRWTATNRELLSTS